jgi:hypothetical protein
MPAATPSPAPPPTFAWSAQRIAGVAVASGGLAVVGVGAALGVVALNKASALKSGGQCNADLTVCTPQGATLWHDGQALAHGATAALVVGSATVVAGTVVFLTVPSASTTAASKSGLRLRLGPVASSTLTGLLVQGGW